VTGTGTFCSFGTAPFFFPGIEIQGHGELAFPLSAAQAKQLAGMAEAAPFGKGAKTIFDESVRKCWQLDSRQLAIRTPQWKKYLAGALERVAADLGIEGKISAHLYKLLIYGKGGHFKAHRDTEKLDAMFGTLIIALPSAHEGGQLFVRHGGREVEIDFSRENHRHEFQHAAFFADCEHEVVPVRSGYRCCLVYNLRLDKGDPGKLNVAPDAYTRALVPALRDMKAAHSGALTAVLLDHSYTEANFSLKRLKGHDTARARALLAAAVEVGFSARLALVTRYKMGELEADISSSRRRRWGDDDDIDPHEGEMGEVYEDTLTIEHWRDARNRKLHLGAYRIHDDDLLSRDVLGEGDPDEKEAEGYTGNAGCTMEFWYRRAAVVLWRAEDEETILCRYDLSGACRTLADLAEGRKRGPESPFHRLGVAVTGRLAADLRSAAALRFDAPNADDLFCGVLRAIGRTESRDLLGQLLASVPDPAWNLCGATLWQDLHKAFGAETFASLDARLLKEEPEAFRGLLFRRLAALRHCKTADEAAARIAARLVRLSPPSRDAGVRGYLRRADPLEPGRGEIRTILSAGRLFNAAADRRWALAFVLADRSLEHVRQLLGPVLAEKSLAALARAPGTVAAEASTFCIDALAKEIATPLPPYPDWTRPYPAETEPEESIRPQFGSRHVDPAGEAFRELRRFMLDADARQHGFRYREDIRGRLEAFIRQHGLDLDPTTIRTGSPHALSCTKNDHSHRRALARRAEDEKLLGKLAAI